MPLVYSINLFLFFHIIAIFTGTGLTLFRGVGPFILQMRIAMFKSKDLMKGRVLQTL